MFGYIIVNKDEMKFREFDIYQSFYCGLCRTLRDLYGIRGQITLSYDMTFLVMLLTSLYEPKTTQAPVRCIAHPFEKHKVRRNQFSDYAADMNILLSYYKCYDDWDDEHKCTRLMMANALKPAFRRIKEKYPEKAHKIESCMAEISTLESRQEEDVDKVAGLFGMILGEVFSYKKDEWEENLKIIGYYLGKFIYLMDTYEDIEKDKKDKVYNPLESRFDSLDFEEECSTILNMLMAECSKEFEKLPVIDNIDILRNILYSGVWYRYNAIRIKREKEQKHE